MAPKTAAVTASSSEPPKSKKGSSLIDTLKSSIFNTKLKLGSLRTSDSKVTKPTRNNTDHERLQILTKRISETDSSTSSESFSHRPTPDTTPASPSPHTPLQGPSTLTAHDFEVGGTLGTGKFGRVYLARHLSTNYICALKIISRAQCSTHEEERLIRREIEVHQNLAHKNILKLLSWFHDNESIYLVLEYAAGGSLYSRLGKQPQGHFSEHTTAQYVSQMAEALRYMHAKNIIHRDIKPENILLGLHHEIKLADFGYSVHSESGFRSTVCGTLDYLSPEVAVMMLKPGKSKEYYTKAVDQWGLGALMYELLVGRPPFEMKSSSATQKKIANFKGRGIKFPEHVSRDAKALVRELLDMDAEKRLGFDEVLMHPWILRHVERST